MQIKLNKSGRPIAAKPDITKPETFNTDAKTAAAVTEALKAAEVKMDEAKAAMPGIAPQAPKAAAEPTAIEVPKAPVSPVAPVISAAPPKAMGVKIEDTLKKFMGQQVRVYMADHEYVSGRLDIVEDGWIKLCNGRSAGSDYYFDEDIINTNNIVRVRVSVAVEKSDYVDFMNGMNK